jgi:maltose O-acetyltransferase
MPRTEKQKMLAGELYSAADAELQADLAVAHAWLARYNAAVGADVDVRPPFHCDYGYNIRLGDGVFLNFNCVILDVVEVSVGERTQIGPGVQILAADHPREAAARRSGLEFGRPVRIGADVWTAPAPSSCRA